MNRYLHYFLAVLMYPLLTAQVPYEYFDIDRIEPARVVLKLPVTPGMPSRLILDANTQKAGDLTLSEPFAPVVGTYKRRIVFSKIHVNQIEQTISIEQDLSSCVEWDIERADPKYTVFRSALLYQHVSGDEYIDIPSDSPEMKILSFRYMRSDKGSISDVKLYRCGDDRYVVKTSGEAAGDYRIEYDTASLEGTAKPLNADFFEGIPASEDKLVTSAQHELISVMYAKNEEIGRITSGANVLAELIRYFQGFKSEALDGEPDGSVLEEATSLRGERILREKKGLCRHRAFLLMLIANDLGYPARIAANEIHAFVELKKGDRWYPVELGGMANSLTVRSTSATSGAKYQKSFSFLDSELDEGTGGRVGVGGNGSSEDAFDALDPEVAGAGEFRRKEGNHRGLPGGSGNGKRGFSRDASRTNVANDADKTDVGIVTSHVEGNGGQTVSEQGLKIRYRAQFEREKWSRSHGIEFEGEVLNERRELVRERAITVELSAGVRKKYWTFKTDETGHVSARVKLDPDWPLGATTVKWYEVHAESVRRME